MASELNYVTAAVLRQRCHNVSTKDFADADLERIITTWEHNVHLALSRPVSSPFANTEDVYESVQYLVQEGAASEVFSAFHDSENEAKQAKANYDAKLTRIEGEDITGVSKSFTAKNTDGPWLYGSYGEN
jgi:hypothetical protein